MTKILMLVNWKVSRSEQVLEGKQPPDYVVKGQPYWFYRYFQNEVQVDILDISSLPVIEKFERDKLRFYVLQALRAIPRMYQYDLVISHGMQSGVVVSLWRRFFPGRCKHIVFEIGSFNSASESGSALKLMQFASRSIDGLIYHTGTQIEYYKKCFPWLTDRAHFVKFGTDSLFFGAQEVKAAQEAVLLCVGYIKRDWDTLINAYARFAVQLKEKCGQDIVVPTLKLVGKAECEEAAEVKLPEGAKIELVPYIPMQGLMEEIRKAVFCILPLENFNYSFGQMTLLQQMAMGKAVLTARVCSMLDYVEDGRNALFYTAKDTVDLSDKMLLLWKDEILRATLGANAAAYVRKEHNEKDMAEQIEKVYQDVLRDRESI